jgi:hypothetical protein
LMGVEGSFDELAVHNFGSTPSLGSSHDQDWPLQTYVSFVWPKSAFRDVLWAS